MIAETNSQTNVTINSNFPLNQFRYIVLYHTIGSGTFPNAEVCTFLNSCVMPIGLFRFVLVIQSRWVDDSFSPAATRIALARYVSDTQVMMSVKGGGDGVARLYGIR